MALVRRSTEIAMRWDSRARAAVFAVFLIFASWCGAQAPPETWTEDLTRFAADEQAHPPGEHEIVFYGSSSFRLWPGLEDAFAPTRARNRGFGGSTTAVGVAMFDRIVMPLRPRTLVLYFGDNDLSMAMTPEAVISDWRRLFARIDDALPDARVIVVAIKPSPAREGLLGAQNEVNAELRALAAARRETFFVDIASPMLDARHAPRAELFGPDALHMNARGYAVWRPLIAPLIE